MENIESLEDRLYELKNSYENTVSENIENEMLHLDYLSDILTDFVIDTIKIIKEFENEFTQ